MNKIWINSSERLQSIKNELNNPEIAAAKAYEETTKENWWASSEKALTNFGPRGIMMTKSTMWVNWTKKRINIISFSSFVATEFLVVFMQAV